VKTIEAVPADSDEADLLDLNQCADMPQSDEAVLDEELEDPLGYNHLFKRLNVLYMEDSLVNQKVVKRLIGDQVNSLHFASNGQEGLNILHIAPIDVILMDIHMPVMNGIETTMEIRRSKAAYANVAIISLTADPDYQQKNMCKSIGMNDTIGKPVRRGDIFKAFEKNLGHLLGKDAQAAVLSA
ncbi:MAG: response regulator, partial [Litorimonas sp.]